MENILVIKIGGGAGLDVAATVRDIGLLAGQRPVVVVHGVSERMAQLSAERGITVEMLQSPSGHSSRYTPPAVRDLFVEAAMQVNSEIVAGLREQGAAASSVSEPVVVQGDDVPKELLDAIIDDLVARTGADRSAVKVLRAATAIWSDSTLGCPKSGMDYTQVEMGGYWVILSHEDEAFDYRADDGGRFVLCEAGVSSPPTVTEEAEEMTIPSGLQGFVNQAKEDLAERLDVEASQIEVIEVYPVVITAVSLPALPSSVLH